MNVQQLIDILNKVEDKSLTVSMASDSEGNELSILDFVCVEFVEKDGPRHYNTLHPSDVEEMQHEDPDYVPQQALVLWP